jgi:drug/metabolite transporter (DMT)-like permease
MTSRSRAELDLVIGAICIGFAPIYVRLLDVPPTVVGFYRCALAALMLLPFVLRGQISNAVANRSNRWPGFAPLLVAAGLVFSLDLAVWHQSVLYVGAGIGTLLANSQVFYLGIIQQLRGETKPTSRFWIAVVIGLGGIGLIAAARSGSIDPDNYPLGIVLGLTTGLIYATYVVLMKRVEAQVSSMNITAKIFWVSLWTATGLMVIAVVRGENFAINIVEFMHLTCLALISQVAGWLLITRSLSKVPINHAGLIILLQPVCATALGAIWLGESLNSLQMIGSVVCLFAIYWGRTGNQVK